MRLIFIKLKKARTILGLTQNDVALQTNINQKDISLLEVGKKEFVPEDYLYFLNEMGIDLNSLFDMTENVRKQSDLSLNDSHSPYGLTVDKKYHNFLEQQHKEDKETMQMQRDFIKTLKEQLEDARLKIEGRAASA